MPTASAANRGALSSADWTTFNNKAAALSGTINTIAYWDSATTIASLALATYPSLTELSYVKGVTSAIQTQFNAKQATVTLTTTGTSGAATFVANTLNIPNYADGGVLSLSAIGATANANGATITGTVLNLQPASASFGGVVTTGTQSFAGAKTLTAALAGTSAVFSSTVQSSAYYLTGMTAGNGALYWTSDRVTVANYNATGKVQIEANGGTAVAIFGGATYANDFTGTARITGQLTVGDLSAIGTYDGVQVTPGQFGNYALTLGEGGAGLSLYATHAAVFQSTATASAFIPSGSTVPSNGMYLSAANTLNFATNTTNRFSISSAGAATFSSTIASAGDITITKASDASFIANNTSASGKSYRLVSKDDGKFYIQNTGVADLLNISSAGVVTLTGALSGTSATFISSDNSGSTNIIQAKSNNQTVGIGIGYQDIRMTSTNSSIFINGNGTGAVYLGNVSTGNIILGTALTGTSATFSSSLTAGAGNFELLKIQGATVDYRGLSLYYSASAPDGAARAWQIAPNYIANGRLDFLISSSNSTAPTTSKGYIDGTTGAYVAVSDLRAKKNIVDCSYGLTEIMAMRPVIYNMIEEKDGDAKHLGFIAQEIKEIVNEAVSSTSSEEELYGLDKSGLIPILVKAIQELKAEIDLLKI